MADGDEEKAMVMLGVRTTLTEPRNGVKLPPSFIHMACACLNGVIEDQADLEAMTPQAMATQVSTYYLLEKHKALAPQMVYNMEVHLGIRAPVNLGDARAVDEGSRGAPSDEEDGAGDGAGDSARVPVFGSLTSAFQETAIRKDIEKKFPKMGHRLQSLAVQDCVAQGLNVLEIIALSGSVEMGKVLQPHEVAAEGYTGDPRAYDAVRKSTKYDQHTMSKLLDKGNWGEVGVLMGDLSRDYSQQGHPIQAMLLANFYTETQSGFGSDEKAAIAYFKSYRRVYAGRGFPEPWAERMAVRARNSVRDAAGPVCSKEEVTKMVAAATKEALSECDKLRSQVANLGRRNNAGQGKGSGKGAGGAGGGKGAADRLAKMVCYKCEQTGHMARNCPQDAGEADDA